MTALHVIFLPGGGGSPEFWHPLGALLPADWKKTYLSWPGLGKQPYDATINSFDDLVALAEKEIQGPTVLIAQSLGGVVGIRLALKHPSKLPHLVLVATSGGVDIASLGGEDWRPAYLNSFPDGARWITEEKPDHTKEIPAISCPTLLLWGDDDSISPVPVGRHFLSLLPNAQLHVVEGGDHYFARDRAASIAPLVVEHLKKANDAKHF
jgi:pimeloyl-ACP methyl ester carboxylesterase